MCHIYELPSKSFTSIYISESTIIMVHAFGRDPIALQCFVHIDKSVSAVNSSDHFYYDSYGGFRNGSTAKIIYV